MKLNNFRKFILKTVILLGVIFITRIIFQFPVEFYNLEMLSQTPVSRVFSKIDMLKVLSFVGIFFALFYKNKIEKTKHPELNLKKSIIYLILAEMTVAAYYAIRYATNYYGVTQGIGALAVVFIVLIVLGTGFLLFSVSVFQPEYLTELFQRFKKEFIFGAPIIILLYLILMFFQSQWFFFSKNVSTALFFLLKPFYEVLYYFVDGSPILQIGNFAVAIGSPCSGVDSMLLFVAFFTALFALDHRRLKKGLYAIVFVLGLIGVVIVNILRLLLLILVGVHISPDFAVGMFHTNAGWLLFVIYFVCYYWLTRRFIYIPKKPLRKK